MKIHNYITMIVLALLLASCEKEEQPVELPPKPSEVKLLSVDMGKDYRSQVFVDLASGKTQTIDNLSWDLAFDASPQGMAIYQNSGKNVLTANSGSTEFQTNPDTKTIAWKWDPASGNKDSLALKNVFTSQGFVTDSVYYINTGSGKFQFKIIDITTTEYVIAFTDLANSQSKQLFINKDPRKAQVYFSFDNGGQYLNIEPDLTDWHVCFLRYRWIYYEFNPPLLYLVSGVFVNPALVTSVKDSVLDFYSITKTDCASKTFLSNRDVVGFDWKSPDLSNTSNVKYTIRKDYYYFIKEQSSQQRLFKIRFLDFYNDQGVKGSPKFEVQEL